MNVLLMSMSCSSLTLADVSPLWMVTCSEGWSGCSIIGVVHWTLTSSRHSLCSSDIGCCCCVGGSDTDWLMCAFLLWVLDKIFCILLLNCRLPWAFRSFSKFCLISCESGGMLIETFVLSEVGLLCPLADSSDSIVLPGDTRPAPAPLAIVAIPMHLWVLCVTLYRNFRSQWSQEYGKTPVWILRWTRYDTRWRKLLPQVSQTKGLSPLWIRSWFWSVDSSLNDLPQTEQEWGFSSVW